MHERTPRVPTKVVHRELDEVQQRALDQANEMIRQAYDLLSEYDVITKPMPVGMVQWIHISKVQANDYNPNAVAGQEMKLLHTSISEDGYCVEETTPVLMADLTWKEAGFLVPGDRLIAFDEEPSPNEANRKHARRFRESVVISNHVEPSPLWEVRTDRGTVRVTGDHPFLGQHVTGTSSNRTLRWLTADSLTAGDQLVHFFDPWETDYSWEAGWLSGFLDGEGTLAQNQRAGNAPHVRLSGYQRPSATADRMMEEFRKRAPATKIHTVRRSGQDKPWSDMVMCRVDRLLDIMRLLGTVRPRRLLDLGAFWEGSSIALQDTRATVLSVEQVGEGNIARLSTSTKTYIASGFAVHNTQPVVAIYDPVAEKYVIVDGFHRFTTMKKFPDIYDSTGGYLPVVVIDKPIADRIASTVRHNRARGKHSVAGMGNLVFQMLEEGMDDQTVCVKLGLDPEELMRLKHITGYSKLYADSPGYSKVLLTGSQMQVKADYKKEHPDEPIQQF